MKNEKPSYVPFKLRNSKLNARIQRGEEGPDPPPDRTQKYRVSYQYWSGSPEILKNPKLPSQHKMLGHHRYASFKWRFADGPMMVRF